MSEKAAHNALEVRVCETLAQKLYVQCRDSPSSYKDLTGSVRRLRNILGEVYDALEPGLKTGPEEIKVLDRVADCRLVLGKLDLALASFKCSSQIDVKLGVVFAFKSTIEDVTDELIAAYESLTNTGEIVMKLDSFMTTPLSSGDEWHSPPSSASGCVRLRESRTSSAWSVMPTDDTATEDGSESVVSSAATTGHYRSSDEKELWDPSAANRPVSSPETPQPAWSSPFAIQDPMSFPAEEAHRIIFGAGDGAGLGIANLGDAAQESTLEIEVKPERVQQAPALITQASEEPDQPQLGINADEKLLAKTYEGPKAPSKSNDIESNGDDQPLEVQTTISPESTSVAVLDPDQSSDNETQKLVSQVTTDNVPQAPDQLSHLGGHDLTPGLSTDTTTQDPDPPAQNEAQKEAAPDRLPEALSMGTTPPREASHKAAEQLASILTGKVGAAGAQHTSFVSPAEGLSPECEDSRIDSAIEAVTPVDKTLMTTKDAGMLTQPVPLRRPITRKQAPAPPRRRPPPPPKPRRYVVLNPDAPTSPTNTEVTEDLYNSSLPSSPTMISSHAQEEIPPPLPPRMPLEVPSIPQVTVDSSRCLDASSLSTPIARQISRRHSSAVPSPGTTHLDVSQKSSRTVLQKARSSSMLTPSRPALDHIPDTRQVANTSRMSLSPQMSFDEAPRRASLQADSTRMPGLDKISLKIDLSNAITGLRPKSTSMPRRSVDDVLRPGTKDLADQPCSISRTVSRHSRAASTSQVPTTGHNWQQNTSVREYYADTKETPITMLARENISHIVSFWNWRQWSQAESYLNAFLQTLIERGDMPRARRVHHLLGVCHSFQGQYEIALLHFLSVLQTPIRDLSLLDDGDSAAAYWMGDIYALQNRKAEAVFAYAIAARATLFHDYDRPLLYQGLKAEKECVSVGVTNADFDQLHIERGDSILGTAVITEEIVKSLRRSDFSSAQQRGSAKFALSQNQRRAADVDDLDKARLPFLKRNQEQAKMTHIAAIIFEPWSVWPFIYDPFFAMANVQRGRLSGNEVDMLEVFSSDPEAKLPRFLGKLDAFTSTDLMWLISTVRAALGTIKDCEWSEVIDAQGTWFKARYPTVVESVATTWYFSVAIFKHSLRSGFGAVVCPDGISSSRLLMDRVEGALRGVHPFEVARIKRLVRDYLDKAAKLKKGGVAPAEPTATAGLSAHFPSAGDLGIAPPPVPPRPNRR